MITLQKYVFYNKKQKTLIIFQNKLQILSFFAYTF